MTAHNALSAIRLALGALTIAAGVGCSAGGGCPPGAHCAMDARADGRGDAGRPADSTSVLDGGDPLARTVLSIVITPDNQTITWTPSMPATQAFQAIGTRGDGMQVPVLTAAWSLVDNRLGTIDGTGTFTANGVAAGPVTIQADAPGPGGMLLHATATLNVRIVREITATGVPPNVAMIFHDAPSTTDPAQEAGVVYPLDQALMPNNVAPPDIQWTHGAAGDLFRVRLVKPDVAVTAYLIDGAGFNLDWLVDRDAWTALLQSDPDAPVAIAVDRYQAATMQVIAGTVVTVRLAHGSIFGVVYYWDLSDGRMQRINAVSGTTENFMPTPPPRASDGRRCVACHAISGDGRYLSAELWDGGDHSTVFDLTADLSTDPPPTVFATALQSYLFSSFSPDDSRLVVNSGNALGMIDPRNGMTVAAAGLPTAQAAHPAWAPDNSAIAFITNTNGGWAVDFTRGDLALLTPTGPDAYAAPMVIHSGASLASQPEGGATDSHPSWSPGSQFIAFAHSPHSRSDGGGGMDVPGALYLLPHAGGAPMRLANAVGGGTPQSYWPTFSPFITSEPSGHHYYWLAFHSRRGYGNTLAGTGTSTRRQIWVTAIDANAAAGGSGDPSNVPYWLPGQGSGVQNMAAQWAPLPCRMNGADCSVSSVCCSGTCLPDPAMPSRHTCQPPMTACRQRGTTCGGASDCCSGLMCIGNVCDIPPG